VAQPDTDKVKVNNKSVYVTQHQLVELFMACVHQLCIMPYYS